MDSFDSFEGENQVPTIDIRLLRIFQVSFLFQRLEFPSWWYSSPNTLPFPNIVFFLQATFPFEIMRVVPGALFSFLYFISVATASVALQAPLVADDKTTTTSTLPPTPYPSVSPAPTSIHTKSPVPTQTPSSYPSKAPTKSPSPTFGSNAPTTSQAPSHHHTPLPTISPVPTLRPSNDAPNQSPTPTVTPPTVRPSTAPPTPSPLPTPPPTSAPHPTPPPTTHDSGTRKHPSLFRILGKTIAWLFILTLAVLLFGFLMSNRYRIFFYIRSAYYSALRWQGTQWVLRKTGLGRLLGLQNPHDSLLNDVIFEYDEMHEQGGLLLQDT